MFRSTLINQCFIVLTLFVTSQIHQLHGAQSAAAAAAPSPKQILTPEKQEAANASLLEALRAGDIQAALGAIAQGAQVNATINRVIPLHMAAVRGNTAMVRALLKAGANPNIQDIHGETPLHWAVEQGNTAMVQALLDAGANPNMRTTYGDTPLYLAAIWSKVDMVNLLLDHGADPNGLFYPTPLLSDDQLSQISLFAGIKKEYWDPAKLNSNELQVRQMYINYKTDKDKETFLKMLKGEIDPSLVGEAMRMVTSQFMLQPSIPLELQHAYLQSQSVEDLFKIPFISEGLDKEYQDPIKLTLKQQIVRRMYINYQTGKNTETLLEVLKNKESKLGSEVRRMMTPEFMLQPSIPFTVREAYVKSYPLSPHSDDPRITSAFKKLETKVEDEESQKIMESNASAAEKEAQMQKLNQSWKNRKDEQNALLLGPTPKEHEASLAALHLEEEKRGATKELLTKEYEERMMRVRKAGLEPQWLDTPEARIALHLSPYED